MNVLDWIVHVNKGMVISIHYTCTVLLYHRGSEKGVERSVLGWVEWVGSYHLIFMSTRKKKHVYIGYCGVVPWGTERGGECNILGRVG